MKALLSVAFIVACIVGVWPWLDRFEQWRDRRQWRRRQHARPFRWYER